MPSNKRSSGRQPIVENDTFDQPNGESPAEPSAGETRGNDQEVAPKAAEQAPPARASEPPSPRGADGGGAPRSEPPPARQGEGGAPSARKDAAAGV